MIILGGGTAGLSAALTLAQFGVRSIVVDRSPNVGGLATELACKGDRECVKCDVCLSTDKIAQAIQSGSITFIKDSKLDMLERYLGRYRATVSMSRMIDDARCTRCGKCLEACPDKAIILHSSREGVFYRVDPDRCRHEINGCQACSDVCKASHIDLEAEEEGLDIEADAVIVATGSRPFDPSVDKRLGYGEISGVVSSLDVERGLGRMDALGKDIIAGKVGRVCFVQCVGSRDPRLGAQLCSKVCCKYSMKIAKLIRSVSPKTEMTFLFMDWRPTDRSDDLIAWSESEKGIRAIRSRPSEIMQGDDGHPKVRYASPGDSEVMEESFDLVVLSLGLRPSPDNVEIADMLGIKLNPHGFFFSEGKQARNLEEKGVVFAGTCAGPKDIEECSMDGAIAASKVFRHLEAQK